MVYRFIAILTLLGCNSTALQADQQSAQSFRVRVPGSIEVISTTNSQSGDVAVRIEAAVPVVAVVSTIRPKANSPRFHVTGNRAVTVEHINETEPTGSVDPEGSEDGFVLLTITAID